MHQVELKLVRDDFVTEITSSDGVADFMIDELGSASWPQERVLVFFLDVDGKVISFMEAVRGTKSSCDVDPTQIIAAGLLANASGMAIAHTHPTDNVTPSEADIDATKILLGLGALFGMPVRDAIIVGPHNRTSILNRYPDLPLEVKSKFCQASSYLDKLILAFVPTANYETL